MLKNLRNIIPAVALVLVAACGGDEAAETEVDAVAEPVPGAVVTPPVTPVPVDPAAGTTTMPMDTTAGATGTMADTTMGDSAAM